LKPYAQANSSFGLCVCIATSATKSRTPGEPVGLRDNLLRCWERASVGEGALGYHARSLRLPKSDRLLELAGTQSARRVGEKFVILTLKRSVSQPCS
jgi:hypothetical protein